MQSPFQIVRIFDPAVAELYGKAWTEYRDTRDVAKLTFIPGAKPTIFWGRRLKVSEWAAVQNCTSDAERYQAAFVRGLVKAENVVIEEGAQPITFVRPTDGSGQERIIPDDALDEFFDPATIQEIGSVIYLRSFFHRTTRRWFPLPPTSAVALAALFVHRAEQTNASSKSDAIKPPPAAPPETPPMSSPAGVASTDATATG